MSTSDRGVKSYLSIVYSVCTQMAKVYNCCIREIRIQFERLEDVCGYRKMQLNTFF